jgi:protein TonB
MAPATNSGLMSRRGLVFVVILVLHAGFFYAINSGLSKSVIDVVFGPIQTKIIEEQKVEAKEPPPPPPDILPPPPDYVPPPDLAIEAEAAVQNNAIQAIQTQKAVAAPPPAPPAPKPGTPAHSDPKHPATQPEYPPTSRRLGEAGTVTLQIYVLDNGKVGDAKILKSSGFERLDEAAVREAKRAWKFVPATEEGKPIASWVNMAVTFKLTD